MADFELSHQMFKNAENNYYDDIKKFFKPGTKVFWNRNGHVQHGTVIMNSYDTRIKITNDKTRKTFWIEVSAVTARHGGGIMS